LVQFGVQEKYSLNRTKPNFNMPSPVEKSFEEKRVKDIDAVPMLNIDGLDVDEKRFVVMQD
jgi:hypothetical protein